MFTEKYFFLLNLAFLGMENLKAPYVTCARIIWIMLNIWLATEQFRSIL